MSVQVKLDHILEEEKWISMERFMEVALYHPTDGYYTNQSQKIGRKGDFYTASSVSDVFGQVWAEVFIKTIQKHNLEPIVLEFGAGTGRFAKQVLESWRKNNPDYNMQYLIVEQSPYHREILHELLHGYHVHIFRTVHELKDRFPEYKGILFANEVLDAFPARVFEFENSSWYEKGVVNKGNTYTFENRLIKDYKALKYLEQYHIKGNEPVQVEVSFSMMEWLKDLYSWSSSGSVFFFVDYGFEPTTETEKRFRSGSMRGYYQHQLIENPLLHPGKMDITYHVNWDCVKTVGSSHDVETLFIENQGTFLMESGLLRLLTDTFSTDPFSPENKRNRAIRSFLLDSSLSNSFQVMQQKKRSV